MYQDSHVHDVHPQCSLHLFFALQAKQLFYQYLLLVMFGQEIKPYSIHLFGCVLCKRHIQYFITCEYFTRWNMDILVFHDSISDRSVRSLSGFLLLTVACVNDLTMRSTI